jgi:DNA-3-methyladenine glycosylase
VTPLPREFYARDALDLARALLGTRLVVQDARSMRIARIVETEAYRGPRDLACHAKVGLTKRTKTLYGPPGHGYVFLIYGMYDCFNVVANAEGRGHAVLIRGVEPLEGIAEGATTNGPGKLTRAMSITRKDDALDLTNADSRVFLLARERRPRIAVTARVGVAYAGEWADKPWRFFDADSKHVSRPSPKQIGRGA